jgi:hypothetical protein
VFDDVAPPKLPVGALFVAFCISIAAEHTPADEEVKSVGEVQLSFAGPGAAKSLLLRIIGNNKITNLRKAVSDMVF